MSTTTYSSLLHEPEQINELTLVYVTNNTDRALDFRYASHSYPIPAGEKLLVPWAAVMLHLGNPHAVDTDNERARTDELHRLKFSYGIHEAPIGPDSFPDCTVTDMEGAVIPTVVSDPEGVAVGTPQDKEGVTPQQIQAQMEQMQRQLEQMLAQHPAAVPSLPPIEGVVERPDGTVKKQAAKKGPRKDGT